MQISNINDELLPVIRTVVFRGFLGENQSNKSCITDILSFNTHFGCPKVAQLLKNNNVEICWFIIYFIIIGTWKIVMNNGEYQEKLIYTTKNWIILVILWK